MSFRSPDDVALPGGVAPLTGDDPRELGGHRLLGRLGRGGMGVVYLGEMRSGRRLAIKVVREEFAHDPEFRVRFRREMSAALTVRGRFLAILIDADLDAPTPWIATEYVPGPTLASAVVADGPMPEAAVRELVGQLAEALDAVHRAGLIHRDLKPANIVLGPDGPCVIDLGIARAVDATSLTTTGAQLGTPMVMAPEQARGGDVSPATDVWALGAVAFFAATGAMPFGQGRPDVMYYRVVHEEPLLDDCPAPLRPFVAACLTKDPAGRPRVREILDEQPSLPGVVDDAVHDDESASSDRAAQPDTVLRTPRPPTPVSVPSPGEPEPSPAVRRPVRTVAVVAAAALVVAGAGVTLALTWPDGDAAADDDTAPVAAGTTPTSDAGADVADEPTSTSTGEPAAGVDECLVGRWEQTSMTDTWNLAGLSMDVSGWDGRTVEFDAEGTETVTYDGADPVVGESSAGRLVDTWSGTAVYSVATADGILRFDGVDNSAVSVDRELMGMTETYTPPSAASSDVAYECTATTHTQRATVGDYTATFHRLDDSEGSR